MAAWALVLLLLAPDGATADGNRGAVRGRFLQALTDEREGRCKRAAVQFERLWREDRLLRPYYAYHAAICHYRNGDRARTQSWVSRVDATAVPAAESALLALEVLVAQRRWSSVVREATAFAQRYPEGPRRWEAMFHRGAALESLGQLAEAAALFRRTWAESRVDSWSSQAEARLAALLPRLPPHARSSAEKDAADWVARGQVLFDRHQNEDAEATFAQVPGARGATPALVCQARYHQAQSVWKQRQRPRALSLFAAAERACREAGDADLTARAMYQRGRCLASAGDAQGASARFAALEAEYPGHRLADDARLRSAELAWNRGDEATAAKLASDIPGRYPDGDMLGEALWRLAYRAYRRGDLDQAGRWLEQNRRLVPRATIWDAEGRAEYWLGRIAERRGQMGQAVHWYESAVRSYPLSVYAMLALHRVREQSPGAAATLLNELATPSRDDAGRSRSRRPSLEIRRAIELARVGLGRDAQRELARADDVDAAPDQHLLFASLLDQAGLWNTSHAFVSTKLPAFRTRYPTRRRSDPWRLAYPRAYADLVDPASRTNGVPPALQLALMREESAFDPRAVSTANCLGLTMLKPETARELLSPTISREALFDPRTNIKGGSKHLAYLLKKFGAVVPVIAAYNAGEGAAGRWLRERGHLPTDEFLEEIPFEETRRYTKRVLASYFAYSWLYESDRVPGLTASRR